MDSDDSLSSVQDYFARLANIPSHYAPSDTRGDLDRKKFLCNLFKTTTEQCRERELADWVRHPGAGLACGHE